MPEAQLAQDMNEHDMLLAMSVLMASKDEGSSWLVCVSESIQAL